METGFDRKPYLAPGQEVERLTYTNVPEDQDFNYIGTVVDKSDPDKLGRIKVASELFGIPDKFLPWVYPSKTTMSGSLDIPEVGTYVEVQVKNGDINSQFYLDQVPDFTKEQLGISTDVIPSSEYETSRVFFLSQAGSYAKLVYGPEGDKIIVTHARGTSIEIDEDGNINIESDTELNITTKSVNIEVEEDFSLTVGGVLDIQGGTTNINTDALSAGDLNLGLNPVKNLACNVPTDYTTKAPMAIGNSNVYL